MAGDSIKRNPVKISVIIPARNEEQYLEKTLQAVFSQNYPDFEVIVVDNASTDRTAQVAAKFPVILLQENRQGTQWALECGRQKAGGEIIARLDADCLPGPDWLAKGAAFFRDPKVVAASGPYYYYDAPFFLRVISFWLQRYVYVGMNFLVRFFHLGGVIIGGNSFMRAAALQKINGFDTRIIFYGDDADLAKRIARVGKVIFTGSLTLDSSARRLAQHGPLRILLLYTLHFFKVLFSKP